MVRDYLPDIYVEIAHDAAPVSDCSNHGGNAYKATAQC